MENRRVVITGTGVVTPVGNNVETFWNNIINGVCGIDFIKSIPTDNLSVKIAGEVKDFNPKEYGIDAKAARKHDKFCLYALAAASQAMAQSGLKSTDEPSDDPNHIAPERLGVYIGSGIGGMHSFVNETSKMINEGPQWISPLFIPTMIANIGAGNVAIAHNAKGVCLPVVTACATGTHSIGEAYRAIKHGYADAIIAGGAEAAVNPLAIGGFANSKALSPSEDPKQASLPFDARRQGFVIAEGAGVVVLEEYERAVKRGATIIAEVCGYGNTCDAYHYTAPRPDGTTQSGAFIQALKEANYNENDLLHINAHGTGTPLNDKSETAAIKLALGEENAKKAIICSIKSMTGHALGAAGGIEIVAAAMALKEGVVPPTIGYEQPDPECDLDYAPNQARKADITIALSSSLGFGGHNAVVALRKF
ncbi:MAG: beta-ketoacyl-ACP synthase II [Bacteroidales bacterium]|jgi:3-oxoacyl-[acyl-carrier-protein] synthase II|nr:beta-ketoacyl-ACP synthase II [Bacteroidales bacterium]MBQ5882687.1 beta-ketoacyl-ACP synthase II [Bacteroidales bacterium]